MYPTGVGSGDTTLLVTAPAAGDTSQSTPPMAGEPLEEQEKYLRPCQPGGTLCKAVNRTVALPKKRRRKNLVREVPEFNDIRDLEDELEQ